MNSIARITNFTMLKRAPRTGDVAYMTIYIFHSVKKSRRSDTDLLYIQFYGRTFGIISDVLQITANLNWNSSPASSQLISSSRTDEASVHGIDLVGLLAIVRATDAYNCLSAQYEITTSRARLNRYHHHALLIARQILHTAKCPTFSTRQRS